jgi:hypothetical protein
MPPPSRTEQLASQAKFVFQGTVNKVKAATMADVPVSDRTVVVRVDRVIQAPEVLRNHAGHEITVQLAPKEEPVKPKQTAVFYTNGWIFGDSIAVQSVGHENATPTAMAALSHHPEDPVQSLHTREALGQAAAADLVVTGRVAAVRLPAAEAQARATAATGGRTGERISEHAPLWQEAVIDVDQVHKGQGQPKQVVIRFPASTDVRWYKAPKFHTGQEGVFLLHKEQLKGPAAVAATTATAPALTAQEYTALHPADFQPLDQLPQIMLAVRGS